jgi:hypothetical protein
MSIYRVIQEKGSVWWEAILSVILRKKKSIRLPSTLINAVLQYYPASTGNPNHPISEIHVYFCKLKLRQGMTTKIKFDLIARLKSI